MVLTFRPDWCRRHGHLVSSLALPRAAKLRSAVICDLIGDGPRTDQGGGPCRREQSTANPRSLPGRFFRWRKAASCWGAAATAAIRLANPTRTRRLSGRGAASQSVASDLRPRARGIPIPFQGAAVGHKFVDANRPTTAAELHGRTDQPWQTPMGESFAFRHPLIQEVAAMPLRSTRTSLHAAVARRSSAGVGQA